jgi:hypothetical protein
MTKKQKRALEAGTSAKWLREVYPSCASLRSYAEAWCNEIDLRGNSLPPEERLPLLQLNDSAAYLALLNETMLANYKLPAAAPKDALPPNASLRHQSTLQELLDRAIKAHVKASSAGNWMQRNMLSLGYRSARFDAHVQVLGLQVNIIDCCFIPLQPRSSLSSDVVMHCL